MSMLDEIIRTYGIEKLNSLTKYPSIMTYHNLGEKGSLVESLVDDRDFSSCGKCFITEKIDGTNARIIYTKDDFIIGSREELIFARKDRIGNPQLGIVNTIKEIAENVRKGLKIENEVRVLYGEVYGGNVSQSSKQYTNDRSLSFRIFDTCSVDLSVMDQPIDRISSWREHGGQDFRNVDIIQGLAGWHSLRTVPYLATIDGSDIPTDRIGMLEFLQEFSTTRAGINNNGKSEGIVVRNYDRSLIRKMRFEDYEKTARREGWSA